jgi:D-alanyl-D-alanine-carboxypeptidase/D-alanyl-D-alanine-endopeptidase
MNGGIVSSLDVRSFGVPALLAIHVSCATTAPTAAPAFVPTAAAVAEKAAMSALAPELDAFFERRFIDNKPTALAVGIVLDGELVYEHTFGVRDQASQQPIDGDTLFRIASLTKSVTSLAVLKLRDEGQLELDAPLTRYLPEVAGLTPPARDAPPLTARMLLTHTGGLPDDNTWASVSFGGFDKADLDRLLQANITLPHVPGDAWEYSNLGYALLGRLVERISGVPYREYVRQNILLPLGLRRATWAVDVAQTQPENLAVGYWGDEPQTPAPRESDGVFDAAGGLYVSLHDYARYAAYHLAAYPARDAPEAGPIRRSSLREMHSAQRASYMPSTRDPLVTRTAAGVELWLGHYGFGWSTITTCSEQRVQHGGWEPGYYAGITMLPQHHFALITLFTGHALGPTTVPLFELLRARHALPPVAQLAASTALVDAQRLSVQLLERWDDAVAQRLFDPGCVHYPWFHTVRARLAAVSVSHGPCQAVEPMRVHSRLHGTFRVNCERGSVELDLSLAPTSSPRIVMLELHEDLPADERLSAMAQRIVSVLRGETELDASVVAATADEPRVRKALAHARIDQHECTLLDGSRGDGHARAVFDVQCAEGRLELELGMNDAGQLTNLELHPPHPADALCWP